MPPEHAPDEQVVAFFRRFLPDFYFVNTPLSRMRRHLELLRALPQTPLQIEFHRPAGAQFTEMMLCGYDAAQPGLLARIAGVLADLRVNVHTAWIHTLRDPHGAGAPNAEVVLDTLITSENYLRRTRPLTHKTEASLAEALRALIEHPAVPAPQRGALPLPLRELEARAQGEYAVIKISAPDETGVLHRVAQTVAELGLNIAHAQINTFDNAATDVFFVTDAARAPLEPRRSNPRASLKSSGSCASFWWAETGSKFAWKRALTAQTPPRSPPLRSSPRPFARATSARPLPPAPSTSRP